MQSLQHLSDEALMQRLSGGNSSALDVLYSRYQRRLFVFIAGFLKDRERSMDMLQDVFLRVHDSVNQFDPERSFSTWLFTIAGNACRNELRNSKRRGELLEAFFGNQPEAFTKPRNLHDEHAFIAALDHYLDTLDDEKRMLYNLRFMADRPLAEISEILQIPEGTVKSRLFHLTRNLTRHLHAFNPTNR